MQHNKEIEVQLVKMREELEKRQTGQSKPDTPVTAAKMIRYIEYDMEEFFASCCARYLELAPKGTKLKKVSTPFIDEALPTPLDFGLPESGVGGRGTYLWRHGKSTLCHINR